MEGRIVQVVKCICARVALKTGGCPTLETMRTWFLHLLDSKFCQSRYLLTQLVSHFMYIVAELRTTIQGTRKNDVIHEFRLGMQHDLEIMSANGFVVTFFYIKQTYYPSCFCKFVPLDKRIHCLPDIFGIIEEHPSRFTEALLREELI